MYFRCWYCALHFCVYEMWWYTFSKISLHSQWFYTWIWYQMQSALQTEYHWSKLFFVAGINRFFSKKNHQINKYTLCVTIEYKNSIPISILRSFWISLILWDLILLRDVIKYELNICERRKIEYVNEFKATDVLWNVTKNKKNVVNLELFKSTSGSKRIRWMFHAIGLHWRSNFYWNFHYKNNVLCEWINVCKLSFPFELLDQINEHQCRQRCVKE